MNGWEESILQQIAASTFRAARAMEDYGTAHGRRSPRPADHEARRKKVKAARKASRRNR